VRDEITGAPVHGDPIEAEKQIIIPVDKPGPNDVLLYVLASEVNFNDIWAITGIPVSLFDEHDRDWHVTGSGGVGLIVSVGEEVKREGRLKVGDLVSIYSGQNDLLSPMVGLDPMAADFVIQGYNTPDASHQQFMVAQAPQCFPVLPDLTLEAAGSYMLNLGTVYRALFTTLKIQPGRRIFVEGAAPAQDSMQRARRRATGCMSPVWSVRRNAPQLCAQPAPSASSTAAIRATPGSFTRVPEDPAKWAEWEAAGRRCSTTTAHKMAVTWRITSFRTPEKRRSRAVFSCLANRTMVISRH
jgi:acrylyl-CoA reductase (NADPH)/3-hydroxypropionyl-CoA dehydratase/3-hydroxypropionyl-CoA synthetase